MEHDISCTSLVYKLKIFQKATDGEVSALNVEDDK